MKTIQLNVVSNLELEFDVALDVIQARDDGASYSDLEDMFDLSGCMYNIVQRREVYLALAEASD